MSALNFFKLDKKYTYPIPLIDRAIPFAITEYKMGQFYEGTVSRSFEDITFIRHRQFPDKKDEQDENQIDQGHHLQLSTVWGFSLKRHGCRSV